MFSVLMRTEVCKQTQMEMDVRREKKQIMMFSINRLSAHQFTLIYFKVSKKWKKKIRNELIKIETEILTK